MERGYYLAKNRQPSGSMRRYARRDLERMTVWQLREIARSEKIIAGIVNPLNKDLLIRTILRYRGEEEALLIREYRQEDYDRLAEAVKGAEFVAAERPAPSCSARVAVYEGLAMDFYDELALVYDSRLAGTNALVLDSEQNLCCVFNVEARGSARKSLFLRKTAELPCHEAAIRKYRILFFERSQSKALYRFYEGEQEALPRVMEAMAADLLDFRVLQPQPLKIPAAIDFGTSNSVAGALTRSGGSGLRREGVQCATFYDLQNDWAETSLLPSVVAVYSLENPGEPEYRFGYEALDFAEHSYSEETVCLFYDIKRWIADYEKEEELTDKLGRRAFVPRKEILRAYLLYMIRALENRMKCLVTSIHMSSPVKQSHKFQQMFREILPEYAIERRTMIDEGVAVLYHTISSMIEAPDAPVLREGRALIIDCGGGTTDISSCAFSIEDERVAYRINIQTSYENGSTDFGGNNLTYRILQLLKLRILEALCRRHQERLQSDVWRARQDFFGQKETFGRREAALAGAIPAVQRLMQDFGTDIFRRVDEEGAASVYADFQRAYHRAEEILPTRFREWEKRSPEEYFKVRNNFYFLFRLAERVKQGFFSNSHALSVRLEVPGNHLEGRQSAAMEDDLAVVLPLDKWQLSLVSERGLEILSDMPDISFRISEIEDLLAPDIYAIVARFMDPLYENGTLETYNIIKLSGQSCKIDLFRAALKEFVPGKVIKMRRKKEQDASILKMSCINGVLAYLRDKMFGYADVTIEHLMPHLPYILTGFTHSGEEVTLVNDGEGILHGVLSRTLEDLTLELCLKDEDGHPCHSFTYYCTLEEFEPKTQEEIEAVYDEHIPQDDTDNIIDREVKFFVWAEPMEWGFLVVPVYRAGENLHVGRERFFSFEDESWALNFFDGTK